MKSWTAWKISRISRTRECGPSSMMRSSGSGSTGTWAAGVASGSMVDIQRLRTTAAGLKAGTTAVVPTFRSASEETSERDENNRNESCDQAHGDGTPRTLVVEGLTDGDDHGNQH